jgi:SAM-dependent methyltransferase
MLGAGLVARVLLGRSERATLEAIDTSAAPRPDVDAPFIATPQDVVDKMLEMADLSAEDVVYDLGCGDGRIVVTAAKRFGCRATGYDNNPDRVRESLENVRKHEVEHLVTISQQDIFTLDLSGADVVTLYLLPRLNVKLIPQLEKLKPGSRIISHDFDIEGIEPERVVDFRSEEGGGEHRLYRWTAPLRRP